MSTASSRCRSRSSGIWSRGDSRYEHCDVRQQNAFPSDGRHSMTMNTDDLRHAPAYVLIACGLLSVAALISEVPPFAINPSGWIAFVGPLPVVVCELASGLLILR